MSTKPTLPPSIWAENRPTLPPTTDSQWGQGFEYTSTTSGGKALTETFDYPLFKIDESLRWLRDLFDNDGNLVGLPQATTAQAQAGTDDEAYLTSLKGSQLVDYLFTNNQNLSVNGYQEMPGGLIKQWQEVTITGQDTVSFPFPFPSGVIGVKIMRINSSSGGVEYVQVVGETTTDFEAVSYTSIDTGKDTGTLTITYEATGY